MQLPGWEYPAVVDTLTGSVRYDNYGGRWGEQAQLDRFLQGYAVEKAKLEARRKGYAVTEQSLENGSIKLQISRGPDMTVPRRRIVRPAPEPAARRPRQPRPPRCEAAAAARPGASVPDPVDESPEAAFHAVERAQEKIARLERQLARLEEPPCRNDRTSAPSPSSRRA